MLEQYMFDILIGSQGGISISSNNKALEVGGLARSPKHGNGQVTEAGSSSGVRLPGTPGVDTDRASEEKI